MATCAAHNYRRHECSPKSEVDYQTGIHKDRDMYGRMGSSGLHWGPLDPCMGINVSQHMGPHTTGSNPLSGSIMCPAVCPSGCP